MKIVVVSPHRDDAAFSLSLSIQAWLAAGHRITILNCFTRSLYAPFSHAESLHENDRMSYVSAVRLREDQTWLRLVSAGVGAGTLALHDLNLKDAPIRLRCTADNVCATPVKPDDKTFGKVTRALTALAPDALILPLAIGSHVDHLTARVAALSWLSAGQPAAFYEDLPYSARPGAAEQLASSAAALDRTLLPVFGSPERTPAAAFTAKRKLALCYDSQVDDAQIEQIAGFAANYAGRERLWANAAWLQLHLTAPEAAA